MWVDYKKIREELSIERVMIDSGVELHGSGDQRKSRCPFEACRDSDRPTFSVNVAKGLWKCWQCGAHGNVIDFAARMEKLNPQDSNEFRRAAMLLSEKYKIVSVQPKGKEGSQRARTPLTAPPRGRAQVYVNVPLDFELKDLDARHSSVQELGLKPGTVERFGIGYCARRGMFQGRVAMPIHDTEGRLVGYAGRIVDERQVSPKDPRYLFPDQERIRGSDKAVIRFDRSRLIYNAHRLGARVSNLVVVQDPAHVWMLHDRGVPAAVAILGPVSEEQVEVLGRLVDTAGTAWFLTDAGEPVQSLVHLSKVRAVRWLYAPDARAVQTRVSEVR